jgi:glucose-1-phosphate adenylyltransferase
MEVKPTNPTSDKLSMEIYIIEKRLFEYLIEECEARGLFDFNKDVLVRNLNKLKILGFAYDGYLANIDSIQSYFKHNLELFNSENYFELFHRNGKIYTKVRDEVPAKYGINAKAENSLVADGCIINGHVENCVLFRGVKVAEGAVVKNSVIMQDAEIQDKVVLENVILDKEVIIRKGKHLVGQECYPVVIRKGAVI